MRLEENYSKSTPSRGLEKLRDLELTFLIMKIGSKALSKVFKENHELGLTNFLSRNGKLYFEYADGTITQEVPEYLKQINL